MHRADWSGGRSPGHVSSPAPTQESTPDLSVGDSHPGPLAPPRGRDVAKSAGPSEKDVSGIPSLRPSLCWQPHPHPHPLSLPIPSPPPPCPPAQLLLLPCCSPAHMSLTFLSLFPRHHPHLCPLLTHSPRRLVRINKTKSLNLSFTPRCVKESGQRPTYHLARDRGLWGSEGHG